MAYLIKEKGTNNAAGTVGTIEEAKKSLEMRKKWDAEWGPIFDDYEVMDLRTGKIVLSTPEDVPNFPAPKPKNRNGMFRGGVRHHAEHAKQAKPKAVPELDLDKHRSDGNRD